MFRIKSDLILAFCLSSGRNRRPIDVIAAERGGLLREKIRPLCCYLLLVIDEIEHVPVMPGDGSLYFQLIDTRSENVSEFSRRRLNVTGQTFIQSPAADGLDRADTKRALGRRHGELAMGICRSLWPQSHRHTFVLMARLRQEW